jgi:hypothetical protein
MMRLVRTLAATLLLTAFDVHAEEGPTERDRNVARESVYQGDDLAKRGDFKGALEAYRRANAIMKVPTTGIEVVRTSLKLGLLVEALEACRQTAAYPPKPGEPEPFTKARNEAKSLMASLRTRIPKLTVAVMAPEGVVPQVVVDDAAVTDYVLLPLNPGTHRVTVSAPDLVSAQEEVTLAEGESKRLEVVLRGATSQVTVVTKGSATYWPLAYTGFALTAAGLGVGAATGVLSLKAADELAANCRLDGSCPPDKGLQPTIDRRNTLGYLSTAGFALAGVGAAIAIPALVVSLRAKKADAPPVAIAPLFDVGGRPAAGATVTLW